VNKKLIDAGFNFDNSYADQLKGFYAPISGEKVPAPELLKLNRPLLEELGVSLDGLQAPEIAQIFSGSVSPVGATPLAQAYAGHQFGSFSPQLGDGRALLLGELIDLKGVRRDIHLKGSGRTPFSRGGDGKAAIGPVLREYIMGEAMHVLNVPTTRALAAVSTGEKIMRDGLLPGAVLTRVASSHLRVGTFEYFAARDEENKIKQLADYAIRRHYPDIVDSDNPYLELLKSVSDSQASLIAKWMLLGFVHGVMNTDNMTISGETIDYGPCAFMDNYDLTTVFSSIDRQGRYAYGNQPSMAQWNLARLAETLLHLIDPDKDKAVELATSVIENISGLYQGYWLDGMRFKLGLSTKEENDLVLASELFQSMDGQNVDFTNLFCGLADTVRGKTETVEDLFDDVEKIQSWQTRWSKRLTRDSLSMEDRITMMNSVNPIYIPRNHKVEEAVQAVEKNLDFEPFEKLMLVFAKPFEEGEGLGEYSEPAPKDFYPYQTFCGT